MISAGIAEGRGGYPGGRGKPDWTDYVEEQQRNIAVLKALVETFGEAPGDAMEMLHDYEKSFPAARRLMGEGYEPHVDDVAGRLIYSLPVDSSIVTVSFSYPIRETDIEVLLADPYRRAVLEVVAHTVLQRSMIRGNPEVTQVEFSSVVERVLHKPLDVLADLIAAIDRDHRTSVEHFAQAAMARRRREAEEGSQPCAS